MAKNYILEPTEIDMTLSGSILFSDSFSFNLELDFTNSFFQVGDLVLRWNRTDATGGWQLVEFTPNGDDNYEGGDPIGTLTNNPSPSMHRIEISWMPGGTPELLPSGTYTVSIYTETEDPADPYPVKNFTYEHAEVAKNDIEEIIQAFYMAAHEEESQTAHGHSPADRLVIAVAKIHGVDPETALTTGNYPNQMKRIAAIIRGDFSNDVHNDGELYN